MNRAPDVALGLAAFVLGLAWYWQAAAIEDSLLSDAVGAGGVPMGLAALMAAAGAALVLRSLRSAAPASEAGRSAAAHAKAAGLLALMVGYVLAAPLLGYPLAIGLFAVLVAAYAGARISHGLAAFGAGLAAMFWIGFVGLLGVAFPIGTIFGG